MPDQELCAMLCNFQPFRTLFHLVVERGKHPHFTALKPYKFISIEYLSFPVQAGEKTTAFLVDRILHPKRDNIAEELCFVLFSQLFKIFFHHRIILDLHVFNFVFLRGLLCDLRGKKFNHKGHKEQHNGL